MASSGTRWLTKADVTLAGVYSDYRRLTKALMVGVLATLVDATFLMIFKNIFGIYWLFAGALSYLIGMGVSFYSNRTFTFRNTSDRVHYQAISFAVVALTQFLLTMILLAISGMFVDNHNNVNLLFSKVVVAFIGFFYAFTLNKSLTFKLFK